MKINFKKRKNLIILLSITALAICLCCVFAACSTAQAQSADPDGELSVKATALDPENAAQNEEAAAQNYSRWLSAHYSAKIYTREMWLADLMGGLDLTIADPDDSQTVFLTAYHNGIIDSVDEQPYAALTRRYAAQTLYNALDYPQRKAANVADIDDDDKALSTLIYYGYFIPDENGMIYPDAPITVDEYRQLLEEVRRFSSLNGKTVLAFGDSIMVGKGNRDAGIADLIAEKYGMTALDYSVSGATFGVYQNRSHIPDQIKSAAEKVSRPDVILINGGTNDMELVKCGTAAAGYDDKELDEKTFAGGMEYAALLLQTYWPDTPVVYIRAHDMDTVDDSKEQQYGELAVTLAEKWRFYCVDIYNDTDFCTETPEIRDAYTVFKDKLGHCDGIHPTAIGYAKYYLPLIAAQISAIFG
ncbi:MAG: SGNH/GDSL hydrolase family protein [Ruminococcus sp.]|nr:SGNH/GDSL hydrolase family protein [Ruminococcus sp.]